MNSIAVFARWPRIGAVKTRLSPALPAELSLALHRAMVADTLAAARASGADRRILYWGDAPDPPPPGEETPALPPGFEVRPQRGADLGERMANAFAEMLQGSSDRAVLIGTDCPDLGPAGIAAAFRALESRPVALIPSRDGGYALIGLALPAPGLFERIDWSTEQVLAQTLERARTAGLVVRLLEPLADLDTPEDLVRWIARAGHGGTAPAPHPPAAHLRAALAATGLFPG